MFLVQPSLKCIQQTRQLCSQFAREWFDSRAPFDWWVGGGRGKLHSGLSESFVRKGILSKGRRQYSVLSGVGINTERTSQFVLFEACLPGCFSVMTVAFRIPSFL